MTEQFLAACNNGNVAALMAILASGVTLYADSGGRVRAPRRPIVGADKVARFFLSIWKMPYREWAGVTEGPDLELQVVQVNDGPAILGTAGEQPIGVLTLDVADGVVQAIKFVANPDKLSGLSRDAHGITRCVPTSQSASSRRQDLSSRRWRRVSTLMSPERKDCRLSQDRLLGMSRLAPPIRRSK